MSAQERFMLIADPHVLPQSIIEADTAFDTYMTKQRKMFDLSEAIWTALMDTATKYHPEVLLIPGDLTRSAEPEGHALINASLSRLREQGIQTLVIPGNDDRPDEIGWDSAYSWLYGNVLSRDPNSYSYAAEPVSGVTVIGLDGTNGRSGTGRISNETMTWALAQTDSAVAKGHTVLVMSHWQILEHFDKKGMLEPTCRMTYADAIRDSLMHHGAQVLITGHFHVNGITTWYDTIPGSNDSIVEITTGSPITYPCPYRWLTVSEVQRKEYLSAVV